MTPLVLALMLPAFAISLMLTAALIRLGHRMGTLDTAGVSGRMQSRSKYGAKRPKAGQAAATKKK